MKLFKHFLTLLEFVKPHTPELEDNQYFKELKQAYPKLAVQLKHAWDGDARDRDADKGKADQYLFPKMLTYTNLEKTEPDIRHNNNMARVITELFKLFKTEFKIPAYVNYYAK